MQDSGVCSEVRRHPAYKLKIYKCLNQLQPLAGQRSRRLRRYGGSEELLPSDPL